MSRCSCLTYGLLAFILFTTLSVVNCSQYASNMFLNGEYQNGLLSRHDDDYKPPSGAAAFISLISKRASPFVGQQYLPSLLECRGRGQQCVPKDKCINGYFTQQLPKVQNCAPEEYVCCTYNPPTPPPTPAPTTPKPFITCSTNMACVAARDCRNGEILSNAVVNLETKKCYEPSVCCGIPSTMLTLDGYFLKTPPSPFTYPQTSPNTPTTSVNKDYLPPQPAPQRRPQPQPQPQQPQPQPRPQPQPQPQQPQPRPQYPAPTPQAPSTGVQYLPPAPQPSRPTYNPPAPPATQPARPQYNPPAPQPTQQQPVRPQYVPPAPQPTQQQPARPQYVPPAPQPTQQQPKPQYLLPAPQPSPQAPVRQPQPTATRPTFNQPPRRIPSTTPPKYLPPVQPTQPKYSGDRDVQSSNQEKHVYQQKPIRGENELSPQIFPPAKYRPTQSQEQSLPTPAKCASALVCTAENYCSSIGVISETPVEITPFRVPLTDCVIEGTGAPGKCCRDPNYVDPWPVNLAGVCATRNKNTKPQGIKDIDANFAEIPWQAMVLKESSKSLLCGGAIIGDGVVLTTASCVQNVAVNDIRVKAGEWELGSTNEPLNFQLVGVKNVAIHPSYDANTGSNDMAVLHLTDRLQFASHIQPICISDKDPSPSETCITTGWGKQALNIHEEGAIMHVTTTSTLSRSDCGADASGVCSATKFDACQFDSGSALACGTGSSVLLKGIYSVENACGEGQAVRFIKPDVAWVNAQFLQRSKPLLLRV
ncbi:inactive serine protease scarface [Cochliomyia hominivorax]